MRVQRRMHVLFHLCNHRPYRAAQFQESILLPQLFQLTSLPLPLASQFEGPCQAVICCDAKLAARNCSFKASLQQQQQGAGSSTSSGVTSSSSGISSGGASPTYTAVKLLAGDEKTRDKRRRTAQPISTLRDCSIQGYATGVRVGVWGSFTLYWLPPACDCQRG